jgi:hypothetical protein
MVFWRCDKKVTLASGCHFATSRQLRGLSQADMLFYYIVAVFLGFWVLVAVVRVVACGQNLFRQRAMWEKLGWGF